MKHAIASVLLCFFSISILSAQEDTVLDLDMMSEEIAEYMAYVKYVDSLQNTIEYQTGMITLPGNIATIDVPEGFKFMNGEDAQMVLVDIWGNPPGYNESLGMLVPSNFSAMADSSYAIEISFEKEGYIKDEDASDIDYGDLLKSMQADTRAANKDRVAMGYGSVELVGWASPPYYDAVSKKLHWAKELNFDESEFNTLNYDVRVLGRRGYLSMNVIGDMFMLDEIKSNIDPILAGVNFTDGNRYADFNPSSDKVAAYGIGGLIAGKVLLKTGILAKLGLLLAKFWKVIAIGVVAAGASIRKFFGGGGDNSSEPAA